MSVYIILLYAYETSWMFVLHLKDAYTSFYHEINVIYRKTVLKGWTLRHQNKTVRHNNNNSRRSRGEKADSLGGDRTNHSPP